MDFLQQKTKTLLDLLFIEDNSTFDDSRATPTSDDNFWLWSQWHLINSALKGSLSIINIYKQEHRPKTINSLSNTLDGKKWKAAEIFSIDYFLIIIGYRGIVRNLYLT